MEAPSPDFSFVDGSTRTALQLWCCGAAFYWGLVRGGEIWRAVWSVGLVGHMALLLVLFDEFTALDKQCTRPISQYNKIIDLWVKS